MRPTLLVGIVTNRPTFWPWLQRQLEAQVAPYVARLEVYTCVEHGQPLPPEWFGDRGAHNVIRVDPSMPLHARRNAVLGAAEVAAAALPDGAWLTWLDDDDLIAPTHLQTIVERIDALRAPAWAVGTNAVTLLDAREPKPALAACPAKVVPIHLSWFPAFTQTAFHLGEGWIDTEQGHGFPPQVKGSDTAWICRLRAEFGSPAFELVERQTYVAIAHGTNRCNDGHTLHELDERPLTLSEVRGLGPHEATPWRGSKLQPRSPLYHLEAFPAAALDVQHPAWSV